MRVLMTKEEIKALYPECGEDYEAYANAGARHAVEEIKQALVYKDLGDEYPTADLSQKWVCMKLADWQAIKCEVGL